MSRILSEMVLNEISDKYIKKAIRKGTVDVVKRGLKTKTPIITDSDSKLNDEQQAVVDSGHKVNRLSVHLRDRIESRKKNN